MWRYGPLLPVTDPANIVSLGEGVTPLLATPRLGERLGVDKLWVKDEGQNPTGTFKARGMACAVSMAKELGVTKLAAPSAGNAGGAMASYGAAAGMEVNVFMPKDVPEANYIECKMAGANTTLVDGLISDCGKIVAERKDAEGWFDVSTLKEPYRIEGKKTMGLELAEQLGWRVPDAIFYPTGGGVGMIGMWKAFDELEQLGWIGSKRPKMICVQAAGCAPIVKAFEEGKGRLAVLGKRSDARERPAGAEGHRRLSRPAGRPRKRRHLHRHLRSGPARRRRVAGGSRGLVRRPGRLSMYRSPREAA